MFNLPRKSLAHCTGSTPARLSVPVEAGTPALGAPRARLGLRAAAKSEVPAELPDAALAEPSVVLAEVSLAATGGPLNCERMSWMRA